MRAFTDNYLVLLRHSLQYLIARGLPGLISFAALVIYTRLLTAEEFGIYALIISGTTLAQVLLFQWLNLVVARFLPLEKITPNSVLGPTLALFIALSILTSVAGLVAVLFFSTSTATTLITLAVPLCITQGWLELNLKIASTQIQPRLYGNILACKSIAALFIGSSLALLGLMYYAPILGLIFGASLSWIIFGRHIWKDTKPLWPEQKLLTDYASYGLPLAITFALGWITSSSDRIILSWLINNGATGIYAAGYDLTQQSLGLLLVIVNTAAYPLVMRALTDGGPSAARQQLKSNGELIITVALTGAAGIIALQPYIINTIIGPEFRSEAGKILPWIAAGAAIAGIKAFHLDIAFQLARQSKWQAYIAGITAAANIALNFVLIPKYGIVGSAASTLFSFLLAGTLSWGISRKIFPMPPLFPLILRSALVAVPTYLTASAVKIAEPSPGIGLISGIATGVSTALAASFLLNVAEIRKKRRVKYNGA